jgi:mono/diheme cytochrome c family protein
MLRTGGPILTCVLLVACAERPAPTPDSFPAPSAISWAPQGWSDAERESWHHRSAGQAFGPLSWVQAVEDPASDRRLMDPDNLRELGFLTKDSTAVNPWAMPVGFVLTDGGPGRRQQVGLTCAACHSGQVEYRGVAVRIDGAPAGFNLVRYLQDYYAGLAATVADSAKWARFATRVEAIEPGTGGTLRAEVEGLLAAAAEAGAAYAAAPGAEVESGHGRMDPFNRIGNAVFGTALRETQNLYKSNAPVSVPYMWDVPRLNWVHHNSSFSQSMSRNVLQILGNGGRVNFLDAAGAPVPAPAKWQTNIDVAALRDLESGFVTLRAPEWPRAVFGAYDTAKARAGRTLYQQECSSCHAPRPIAGSPRDYVELAVTTVPVAVIGTDPGEAETFVRRRYVVDKLLGPGSAPIDGATGLQRATKEMAEHLYDQLGYDAAQRREADGRGRPNIVRAVSAYKARPLDGVWATAPYLHNGSVPTIYDLLSPPAERPARFWLGSYEYDPQHLGYVSRETKRGTQFDATIPGNLNTGHAFSDDSSVVGRIGRALSRDERLAIIEYLKAMTDMPPDTLPAVPFGWEKYPEQLGWRWPAGGR